jgi:signal transduction histidine kinase
VASAALAIVLAVGGFGVAIALLVARDLHSSLDHALRDRASEIARLSVSAPALLTAPGALAAPSGGRELAVEVLDRRGRIVARSPALGGRLLPGGSLQEAARRSGRSGFVNGRLSGEPVRVFVAPLPATGGVASGGEVLVASSTAEIHETLARLRGLIALSALAAAAIGGLLVAWLTGRGLRPLRRLAGAAGRIERSGDAAERLPETPAGAEIAELTRTLNGMLGALERARERERRFLADASHELRTPLTALRGNAGYIARHGADPEALADLEADAARLGRLIDDLLALERVESERPARDAVRLDELVLEAARREPLAVVERCEPASVLGERGALERALDNLVENARVHGPAGGRITLDLRRAGALVLASVADEGAGIPADQLGEAFSRFWRGPGAARRPGSGLGLAIVEATVRRHGGRITVKGSRVTLAIPALVSDPPPRGQAPPRGVAPAPPAPPRRA